MKNPQKGFVLPLSLSVFIFAVLVGGAIYYSIHAQKENNLSGEEIYKISDPMEDVAALNTMIAVQNKFVACAKEIVEISKKQGNTLSPDTVTRVKQCTATLEKEVSREQGKYIVTYSQIVPKECASVNTVPDLLKVEIDARTLQSQAEWVNNAKMNPELIANFAEGLKIPDCESYANFLLGS